MKRTATSTFMYITSVIFLLLVLFTYNVVFNTIEKNIQKDQKILYYQINILTHNILSTIIFQYEKKKAEIHKKHEEVLKYLETRDYNISLDEIYEQINFGTKSKPYNIYITNSNLVITNTTYKPDMGFDVSFAKNIFDQHKIENIIGISEPVFPSEFMSYSDSYLPRDGGNRVLQISYKYDVPKELEELKKLLETNVHVESYVGYLKYKNGFIVKIYFDDVRGNKSNLTNVIKESLNGQEVLDKLDDNEFIIENDENGNINFYTQVSSHLYDNVKSAFSLTLNNHAYEKSMLTLNIFAFIFTIIGLILIWIIYKYNTSEKELAFKNKFIGYAVHEIKTPLSIISLNSQLRSKVFGIDNYDKQIDGAIRTLKNSYDDMTFLMTKEQIEYNLENIDFCEFLEQRVKYFRSIATMQSRSIELFTCKEKYFVKISKIELTRLVDNNLSNAIKYSYINSVINVKFTSGLLCIESNGKEISDTKRIFQLYSRESDFAGGHGLGLSIVTDICKKYSIFKDVKSENYINTFCYRFDNIAQKKHNIRVQ